MTVAPYTGDISRSPVGNATPANDLMNATAADLARLYLLVQRLLDAEVLSDADGAALRGAAEAARRSLEEGDAGAVRRHVEEVAHFTETLVRTAAIKPADGRAVLEVTGRLLTGN